MDEYVETNPYRLLTRPSNQNSSLTSRRKTFYTAFLLLLIVSGTAAVLIRHYRDHKNDPIKEPAGSHEDDRLLMDPEESSATKNDQAQLLPRLRAASMRKKSEAPDRLGRMNIYIHKPSERGSRRRPERHRFPVARYSHRQFPLRGPFISFTPWIPIFVDRLTRQTIIYSSAGGIYILPPLINFYGKMFSVAELIVSGYASLVSSGSQPTGPINMGSYFQPTPLYGYGIPTISPRTGGFVGGVRTNYESFTVPKRPRTHVDMDTSLDTEEDRESEDRASSYSHNNDDDRSESEAEHENPHRTRLPPRSSSTCQKKQDSIYDYIVVGSGPGGATIATRLALNDFKVLLIEAGPDYDDGNTRTPGFWPFNQLNPKIAVHFNPYLYSKDDNVTIEYPRGSTLGGSAQINVMVAIKAHPEEWDYIAQVTGDSNWSHETMRDKYQKRTENCQYCDGDDDDDNNTSGWLNTTVSLYQDPLPLSTTNPALDDLLKDVKSKVKFNPNINKENDHDSYFYPPQSVTKETGVRGSTYKRIKNVQSLKKSNLHVWTDTFVTKLIIDRKTKEACGVEYVKGAHLYKASSLASSSSSSKDQKKSSVYAKREIIVSGGQWMTPQLLQLSGIGDKDLLEKFGIDVIQDLPGVGVNQQEHSETTYVVKLKPQVNLAGIRSVNCTFNATLDDPCLADYIEHPQTALYSSNINLFAMLRSNEPKLPNAPDSALIFLPMRFTGFRKDWISDTLKYPLGSYLTVIMNLVRIQNNLGSVRIQSTNAFDTPLIQLQHFQGENRRVQLNRVVQNIRYLRTLLFEGSHFSEYIDSEELPGRHVQTDEELRKFVEKYVWGHHACCTAKLGNTKSDPLAVLNSKAQVKGITNLRVCDISMFPKIPGYYPFMSIIMACEKVADDIIKQARH